jgi:ribulose-phosphate 3-epimerase
VIDDAWRCLEACGKSTRVVDGSKPVGEHASVRCRRLISQPGVLEALQRRSQSEHRELEWNGCRDSRDELVRRDRDDEAIRGCGDDLLARVGSSRSLHHPAVGGDLVGAVNREVEPSERMRACKGLDSEPERERSALRRRRGCDAAKIESARRERLEKVRGGRAGPETDAHAVFDEPGGRLGCEPFLPLDVRAHVGAQLYSAPGRSISVTAMGWSDWARRVEVEPSIYAADFSRLGDQLGELVAAGARVFHFDVGDGHFIPEITIGPVVLASISPLVHAWGGVLDCHLMVAEPERHFEAVAQAGGDSVTFHVEACDDPPRAIAHARSLDLGAGLVFNPETAVEDAARAAAGADLALCMSIHPGYSGQAFMPEALERISRLRSLLPEDVRVQVDGGINPETIGAARDAGADLIVAGSAVFWSDDPGAAYRRLVDAVSEPARG